MGDNMNIEQLVDFNNQLLKRGKSMVNEKLALIIPEFSNIEYDAVSGMVTVYAEIKQVDDSGINEERRYIELVSFDSKLNHFYVRFYQNNAYKGLIDKVLANLDDIWETAKLYVTICRLTGSRL